MKVAVALATEVTESHRSASNGVERNWITGQAAMRAVRERVQPWETDVQQVKTGAVFSGDQARCKEFIRNITDHSERG
jgi:hypothetical protein